MQCALFYLFIYWHIANYSTEFVRIYFRCLMQIIVDKSKYNYSNTMIQIIFLKRYPFHHEFCLVYFYHKVILAQFSDNSKTNLANSMQSLKKKKIQDWSYLTNGALAACYRCNILTRNSLLALKASTSGGQSPSPARRSKLFVGLQSRVQMRMSFPEQKRSLADKEIAGASPWELPWLIVDFHNKKVISYLIETCVLFNQFQ